MLTYQGLVEHTIYAAAPPRMEYALSRRGQGMRPIFDAMRDWGERQA